MQFSSSLKLNHIFRRLYRKGQSAANGYLVLYCRKNGSRQNRIGLTVSAKLAHAVHRNRAAPPAARDLPAARSSSLQAGI